MGYFHYLSWYTDLVVLKRNLDKLAVTSLDSVWKSRDITCQQSDVSVTKVSYSQSYGFSSSDVWMWELDHKEGWSLKNWYFQIMLLEKTLESPLTARRSNQSILKEINPEYSLEGVMLKLKFQYFAHWRTDSLQKTLMLGKIECRRRGWQRMSMNVNLSKLQELWRTGKPGVLQSMGSMGPQRDTTSD